MNKLRLFICIGFLAFITSCGNNANTPAKTNEKDSTKTDTSTAQPAAVKTILFFGNSLTAGYGLDASLAFPALIQQKIDSIKLPYKVINGGLSGETTAGGNSRIDWLLRQRVDVFILELGGNDGLRGIAVPETSKNLQAIVDKVKKKYPDVKLILAGMQVPPNMGAKYAGEFRAVYKEIADKNNMALVPFLLEGVGGVAELNQQDGIHPTQEGHKIVAENVWSVLKPLL